MPPLMIIYQWLNPRSFIKQGLIKVISGRDRVREDNGNMCGSNGCFFTNFYISNSVKITG